MNRSAILKVLRRAVSGVSEGERKVGRNTWLHHYRDRGVSSREYISDIKPAGEVRTSISAERGAHPDVTWDVYGVGAPEAGQRTVTGRNAMRAVTESMKIDARAHRPSAYVFSPTSASRAKLYAAELKRAGVPYSLVVKNGDYKLVYDPGVLADVVQGLASTAPLAMLAAAAYSQQNPVDEEFGP